MKKQILKLCLLATGLTYGQIQKDTTLVPEVVITETKVSLKREQSGKIIEKITQADLQKRSGQTLAQVLNTVAGLEVNGSNSTNGKNLSYYVRGGRTRQVLILMDGIPITDASGISLEIDLRLLPIEQVESIEVMRGAASTLYGTGAATGVINIITKKTQKNETTGHFYSRFGTNNTQENFRGNPYEIEQGGLVNFANDKFGAQIIINRQEFGGVSQANFEEALADKTSRTNVSAQLSYQFSDNFDLKTNLAFDNYYYQFDDSFNNAFSHDVPENFGNNQIWRFQLMPTWVNHAGVMKLLAGYNEVKRNITQFNSFGDAVDTYIFESRNLSVDLFQNFKMADQWSVLLGTQGQFSDMLNETPFGDINNQLAKFNNLDPYINTNFSTDFGLNLSAGARLNHHNIYGNQWVYHVNPSYSLKSLPLRLMASYGTAFIVPSLYQLYSEFGNLTLTAENNRTIEVGLETSLFDDLLSLNASGFYRDETNPIVFAFDPVTFQGQYKNMANEYIVRGLETGFNIIKGQWQLKSNYTYTYVPEDISRLIPAHKTNQLLSYTKNKFNLSLEHLWVSERSDAFFDFNDFSTAQVLLRSYSLINFGAQVRLSKLIQLQGRVNNILNEKYAENIGFNTLGLNAKMGFLIQF